MPPISFCTGNNRGLLLLKEVVATLDLPLHMPQLWCMVKNKLAIGCDLLSTGQDIKVGSTLPDHI